MHLLGCQMEGVAGLQRNGRLAFDLHADRPFKEVNQLFSRVVVGRGDPSRCELHQDQHTLLPFNLRQRRLEQHSAFHRLLLRIHRWSPHHPQCNSNRQGQNKQYTRSLHRFLLYDANLPLVRSPNSKTQLFSDELAKALLDFQMTRDWRLPSVLWISVNVVLLTMALHIAACVNEPPNEVAAFHATSTVISFVLDPGRST